MRLSLFSSVSALALAMLASATVPSVAVAGFEFVAPEEQNSVAAAPTPRESTDMPAIPADVIEAAPLATPATTSAPQPIQAQEALPAPISEPAGEIVEAPMRIAPQPAPLTPIAHDPDALVMEEAAPAPAPVTQLTADIPAPPVAVPAPVAESAPRFEDEGAVVQGFGRDVPLVLALQQIVPTNYRYSFDGDVQPGMRIDWTGGKPWKSIIVDLARDNGMSVDIVSNVVAFRRKTPLDVVAADTAIDSDEAMVQGLPMKAPVAPLAPVMSFDNANDTPSDSVKSADAKDIAVDEMMPSPVAQAVPVTAPAKKVAAHSETADLIWDKPPADLEADVASSDTKAIPAPKSWTELPAIDSSSLPEPEKATRKVEAPVNLLPPITSEPRMDTDGLPPSQVDKMVPLSDASPLNRNEPLNLVKPQRQELASISDTPEQALAKKLSAAQSEAATPAKEAVQFDTAFDDKPATKKVDEKVILTADSETLSQAPEKKTPHDISAADNLPIPVISEPNAIEPASSTPAQAPIQGLTDINPSVNEAVATNALADQQQWEARKNETLRQALTAWCDRIGVSLVWSSEYDYPLQTDVRIDANFPDAVRTLLAGFAKAQPRPMGRLFKNQQVGAQPVLVVETQRLTD